MDSDLGVSDEAYNAVTNKLKKEKQQLEAQLAEIHSRKSSSPHDMPKTPILSISDVLATRSRRAKSIRDNFALLKAILDRHEAKIRRRWQDKKPKQRLEVLRKAWGTDMALSHRPDLEASEQDSGWQCDTNAKLCEAYMLPYINQEDLSKPRNLLWFMATRGRHHPSQFAAADIQAVYPKLLLGAGLYRGYLPGHVMMFTDRQDFECYGELLNAHEHAHAEKWLNLGLASHVSDGLILLEAQERTMSFLVACAKLILHDVQDFLQSPKLAVSALLEDTGEGFVSLAAATISAQYLPPAQLDFDRIISLLAARRDQAANHLLSLREDPGYFRDTTSEIKEHEAENVKIEDPSAPQGLDPSNPKHQHAYWTEVLCDMITTDHMQYEMYSELHDQAQGLRQMSESFAGVIQPGRILPENYMHALLRFRFYLKESFMHITQSKLPFAGSPPWRNHYHREIVYEGAGAYFSPKDPCRLTPIQKRLESFLTCFASFKHSTWANEEHKDDYTFRLKTIGITKIMDSLQHLIESQSEAREILTPYLAASLGSLATVTECLRQLELYQPWAATFEPMMTVERFETLRSEYDERSMLVMHKMENAYTAFNANARPGRMGRLGAPIEGRFLYPVWRRKNEQTVAILRKAESDLDQFWIELDKHLVIALRQMDETHLLRFLTQPRDLQRTPLWVEPIKAAPKTVRLHTSFRELDLNRQLLTERTISEDKRVVQTKAKTKTRGDTKPENLGAGAQGAETIEDGIRDAENVIAEEHDIIFKLNARALKVFETIFFTPSIDATPGEVAWNDFLYAMKAVGFAPEAMGGSEWHFHPETVDVKHGIVFHSPHPNPKMPYQVARRHGRDLRRAYGWEGHMFAAV
jgi:hypothetical protein